MGPPAGTPYGSAPYGAPPPRTSPFGNLFGQPQPPPAGYGAGTQPWNVTPNPYPGQEPSSLYPNGLGIGPPEWNSADALRLFQNLRIRETWLAGGGDRAMQINDFEIATTVQFPNFFGSTQPLLISPNFVLHTWDGPKPPILTHMPPLAYSAFVEAAYKSDPTRAFGGDLTTSIGVFSDFHTLTSDSIRVQALGYGWLRVTPTFMVKVGAQYLDRNDIKILPAIGVLWEPDAKTRFDIFFPKPKLAHYLTTIGNTDVWGYVGAEYGGGSWTIKRLDGTTDQVDLNDIRLVGGLDWTCQSGFRGNFEVGWVTARHGEFHYHLADNFSLKDTIMLRFGLIY